MTETTKDESVEAAKRTVLNRRAALRRMGLTAGASALAALTIDDLARNVIRRMRERDADNALLTSLDNEFSTAGIAFAATEDPCRNCHIHYCNRLNNADDAVQTCICAGYDIVDCVRIHRTGEVNNAKAEYESCKASHCPDGTTHSPCPPHAVKPCTAIPEPVTAD